MKIRLKDGEIRIGEPYFPIDEEIRIGLSEGYTFKIAFNDREFRVIKKPAFRIPKSIKDSVIIRIRRTSRDGTVEEFTSKKLPIETQRVVGIPLEKAHPRIIHSLQSQIKKLEARIDALESEGDII